MPRDPAQPQLCLGLVRHARLRPRAHAFSYGMFYLRLPLRSLGAQDFAARHPSHRVRWSAWSAIIGAAAGRDERVAMLDSAVADASPLVSGNARATLALVDQGTSIC